MGIRALLKIPVLPFPFPQWLHFSSRPALTKKREEMEQSGQKEMKWNVQIFLVNCGETQL